MTTYVLLLVGTHAAAVALGMGIARVRLVRARQDDALALARAAGVVPARRPDHPCPAPTAATCPDGPGTSS